MNKVNREDRDKLLNLLSQLIDTIVHIRKEDEDNYLLQKNEREAISWYRYLKEHGDKEELKSLESEIAERYIHEFENQLCESRNDAKRVGLLREYLEASNKILE